MPKLADFVLQGRMVRVIAQDDGTVYLVCRVNLRDLPRQASFLVIKEDGTEYVVTPDGACTCPAYKFRGGPCKHVQWCQEMPR